MSRYTLSERSLKRLEGVEEDLAKVVRLAIKRTPVDFGVAWLGGLRTPEEQNQLFKDGYSKCDGYIKLSRHQFGEAVDLQVFVRGGAVQNEKMQCIVAGVMAACAGELDVNIRWGGDWDSDGDVRDNNFNDLYHFELISRKG
ncbi:MAG: M15 family metallopeptidase [Dehalococcoidales bacterium]|jgi:peptidoglycan L-alanyl-D-glutamate endopeptidase CwlK|nr:M15 family metallopeptidase [Dehalococcoidales bacterium]